MVVQKGGGMWAKLGVGGRQNGGGRRMRSLIGQVFPSQRVETLSEMLLFLEAEPLLQSGLI